MSWNDSFVHTLDDQQDSEESLSSINVFFSIGESDFVDERDFVENVDDEASSELVLEPLETQNNWKFWVGVSLCLVIFATVGLKDIWSQGEATRLGFMCDKYEKELSTLEVEREHLKNQLAMLLSPSRLNRIARQDLGLRQPRREQMISSDQVKKQLRQLKSSLRFAQNTHFSNVMIR